MSPEYGTWELALFCKYCNEHISYRQYHDNCKANKGVCIHCGAVSDILPDVTKKSRRKHYTDGRQLVIKAQKLRKSNIVVRLTAHLVAKVRKRKRPFAWEYKDDASKERQTSPHSMA